MTSAKTTTEWSESNSGYAIVKPDRDHFDLMFCLVIPWLESKYELLLKDPVFVMEADEETGKIVTFGNTDTCHAFHEEFTEIIANNPEIVYWREI